MSSNTHSFFAHLDPIQRTTQPTLIPPTLSILPSTESLSSVEFNMHDFIFACAYLINQHQFDVFMDETT